MYVCVKKIPEWPHVARLSYGVSTCARFRVVSPCLVLPGQRRFVSRSYRTRLDARCAIICYHDERVQKVVLVEPRRFHTSNLNQCIWIYLNTNYSTIQLWNINIIITILYLCFYHRQSHSKYLKDVYTMII